MNSDGDPDSVRVFSRNLVESEEFHGSVGGFDLESCRWGCIVERSRAYIVENTGGEEKGKAVALVPGIGLGLGDVQGMDVDTQAMGQDHSVEVGGSVLVGGEGDGVDGNAGWSGGRMYS